MYRDGLSGTRAAVRGACTLSLFAVSFFGVGLTFVWSALVDRLRLRHKAGGPEYKAAWAEEEFQFEHAIEKYQKLIDAAVQRPR
jgi:hypothetical protein